MTPDIKSEGRGLGGFVLLRAPAWFVYPLLLILAVSVLLQTVVWVRGFMAPPADTPTEQCREVVRGTIGIEVRAGIMCLRPVHFIEREGGK